MDRVIYWDYRVNRRFLIYCSLATDSCQAEISNNDSIVTDGDFGVQRLSSLTKLYSKTSLKPKSIDRPEQTRPIASNAAT